MTTTPASAAPDRPRTAAAPIRVAVLDDHPAVRAGLEAILARERDMVSVGAASDESGLWPLLQRTRPSVLVLDLHHPGHDGLALTLRLRRAVLAPRLVLYSGSHDEQLTVAAVVAGADAVVAKSNTRQALLDAVRDAARERHAPPVVSLRARTEAAARLDPSDHAILAMRLAGTSWAEIADTLGLAGSAVANRTAAIVEQLASGLHGGRSAAAA